jgi:hypothetical protein
MDTYPFLQVGLGLLYLVVQVVWIAFFFRRVDPWLRERLGERYGMTLRISGRGLWTVSEKGQGICGCFVELLQIIFWLPAVILPLIIFMGMMMLLSSQG